MNEAVAWLDAQSIRDSDTLADVMLEDLEGLERWPAEVGACCGFSVSCVGIARAADPKFLEAGFVQREEAAHG